ncbi:DNA-binding protein [Pokkaliibacter sp. CJK22405]|uniref:DNA-binding protein n=1 Tax=Pokkaliibacter sp. CJK22405 TaxID=3384615 RepID=UPI00398493FC
MSDSTIEQVKKIADDLLGQGERPTQQRVRDILGRGSLTTINKGLNQWWVDLSQRLKEPALPKVPDPVAKSLSQIWQDAVFYARDELREQGKALEVSYQERRSRMDDELAISKSEVASLQQRLSLASERLESVLSELATEQQRAHQQERELIASQARIKELERSEAQHQLATERLLAIERQAKEQAEQRYAKLEAQADAYFHAWQEEKKRNTAK